MKVRTCGILFVLAVAVLAAPVSRAQCEGATSLEPFFTGGTGVGIPAELFVSTRPDLSNPGARALALGGAFIATADDTTSVVANPAGLGALVRPSVQVEVRHNPAVQYDRFGESGLLDPRSPGEYSDSDSNVPYFVSGVLPLGDRIVVGAFYQNLFGTDRITSRIPSSPRLGAGPCYSTRDARGIQRTYYVPLYTVNDNTSIFRTGASIAFRAAPGLALGATAYYAKESRDQKYTAGDATTVLFPDSYNPGGLVKVEDAGIGYQVGLQYSPSETFRIGLVWSSEVSFGKDNEYAGPRGYGIPSAFRETVLPRRVGAGFSWGLHPRWSLAFDAVHIGTSAEKDRLNLSDFRLTSSVQNKPEFWKQDDTWEFRAGLEWIAVQTRTTSLSARFGGWLQTSSALRFDTGGAVPPAAEQYYFDMLSVLFPAEEGDSFTHATFGLGLVSQKKWQFDVGVDYEFKTKTLVASGLFGVTF